MSGTGVEGAEIFARRLRDAINEASFSLDGSTVKVTASFGICEHIGSNVIEKTIHKADGFLYQAKQRGGDLVVSRDLTSE